MGSLSVVGAVVVSCSQLVVIWFEVCHICRAGLWADLPPRLFLCATDLCETATVQYCNV